MGKGSSKNLIPLNQRSKAVQREIQAKGRQANKEKIQRKKALKECMELALSLDLKDKRSINKLDKMGIDSEDLTQAMACTISMIEQAKKGNVQAFKVLAESTAEQTAQEELEVDPLSQSLEEIAKGLEDDK